MGVQFVGPGGGNVPAGHPVGIVRHLGIRQIHQDGQGLLFRPGLEHPPHQRHQFRSRQGFAHAVLRLGGCHSKGVPRFAFRLRIAKDDPEPGVRTLAAMSHSEALPRLTLWRPEERNAMKRTSTIILAALAGAALFGGLVYAVLVAAHLSGPFANTVYGPTPRRLWATAVVALALIGVAI